MKSPAIHAETYNASREDTGWRLPIHTAVGVAFASALIIFFLCTSVMRVAGILSPYRGSINMAKYDLTVSAAQAVFWGLVLGLILFWKGHRSRWAVILIPTIVFSAMGIGSIIAFSSRPNAHLFVPSFIATPVVGVLIGITTFFAARQVAMKLDSPE